MFNDRQAKVTSLNEYKGYDYCRGRQNNGKRFRNKLNETVTVNRHITIINRRETARFNNVTLVTTEAD